MSLNKTQQYGYCYAKSKNGMKHLGFAVLFLLIGLAMGVYAVSQMRLDKSDWDYMKYAELVIGWLGAAGFAAAGCYEGYTAVRDALRPEKSKLAKSIRSQLSNPEAAPGVKELYAVVDKDIQENGQWFDGVAVGKEWVLGDEASYIPRIRLIFGRDEIVRRSGGNSYRVIELIIMDDRRQVQTSTLHNPNELKQLINCIQLRAPEAMVKPYNEYYEWRRKPEDEWQRMLIEYRRKQSDKELSSYQQNQNISQSMVLRLSDGSVTSRVTKDLVNKTLTDCLKSDGDWFLLIPGTPISANGKIFYGLECFAFFDGESEDTSKRALEQEANAQLFLRTCPYSDENKQETALEYHTNGEGARRIVEQWLGGSIPELNGWTEIRMVVPAKAEKQRETLPPRLSLLAASGAFQKHENFTMEDVEIAAEGIIDGTYQEVELILSGGLAINVQKGDSTDGRHHVYATRVDGGKLRFLQTRCSHRQAAEWFTAYARGEWKPEGKEWKDYTKQVNKKIKSKK